jgi:polar amino acid transport system substrate-binding protein
LLQTAAQDLNYEESKLKNLLTYFTSQGYIAFSKEVSNDIVDDWQSEIDEMKMDGTIQNIYEDYLPGSMSPGLVIIFTEDNPPQNFKDQDGNLSGSSVEIVEAIMDEIGITEHIELTNWTNAYYQILHIPNTMTFSTLRSESRENIFNWVGPVCRKSYSFFVKSDASFQINALDDAKQLGSVGTMTGWSSENQLVEQGFTNVLTWATPTEVFQKLIDGEIDAAVLNDISIKQLAEGAGVEINFVRTDFVLSSGETYLAFSIDTDDKYIQDWKNAYQAIIDNGTFLQIWNKYYPNIDW